jgi:benzylsuccinate CoA-transferase BbsF subunit
VTKQVFEGIRVVEFAWAQVGPEIGKVLANFGATVIHVETSLSVDVVRTMAPYKDGRPGVNRSGFFTMFNSQKYGVTLNLNHPDALEVANKLVVWADIVIENFRPGVMSKWSLDYENIKRIKPDIIMLSSSMQGQTGSHSHHPGYGGQLVSLSGFTNLTGWPDRMPTQPYSAYTDVIAPKLGLAATISALDYRRRTGKGQHFDLSQFEAGLHFLAPILMDYKINGRVAARIGNRHPYAAPHGAYPCKGADNWCVISVFSDEEWKQFCYATGHHSWAEDSRFATLLNRKQNEQQLDELVARWTRSLTAKEVMVKLQQVRVAAGIVQNAEQIHSDPQLKHRCHFKELEHLEIGKHLYGSPPYRFSKVSPVLSKAAPCLGQDNYYVYVNILGMSEDEFVNLLNKGAFE